MSSTARASFAWAWRISFGVNGTVVTYRTYITYAKSAGVLYMSYLIYRAHRT